VEAAARRGLSNHASSVAAFATYLSPQNTALFARHGIFSPEELQSRYEILLEIYAKTVMIESHTMLDMARKSILPACLEYQSRLAGLLLQKRQLGMTTNDAPEAYLLDEVAQGCAELFAACDALEDALRKAAQNGDLLAQAQCFQQAVVPAMDALRVVADRLEGICAKDLWPMPTYSELLYSVN